MIQSCQHYKNDRINEEDCVLCKTYSSECLNLRDYVEDLWEQSNARTEFKQALFVT
jgi:hypothetical protein